jgi:RNA polymerase sigma-70 factor, ECF subfamily
MAGLDALDDSDLIKRSLGGDESAFRALVERYEATVAGVVIGMLGPGFDADDVGQEVFVRFYRAMDRFRGDSTLGTYLTRIAINQSLKALKKRQRWYERFLSSDAESGPPVEPLDSDPLADVQDDERSRRLNAALMKLPSDQRAVIVLRIVEGYSTRETSDILDVPEGTVMSRLKRGLERVRSIVESETIDL